MSSVREPKIPLSLGEKRFVVDCDQYTKDRRDELDDAVACIRRKHSLFSKYPMEEGETREQWESRVQPLVDEDNLRKEGESVDDHLKRLFKSKIDTQSMSYDILCAIADTFELQKPSQAEVGKAVWPKLEEFIYNVLTVGKIPADDFYPRRPAL